jgi:tripartite-type tricarboxylate transporter receptor subunit TctC
MTRVATGVCLAAIVAGAFAASAAHADDFYKGRQVTMLVGNNPGTAYDASARLVARHFGRAIPGQPTIVVQNMPGATGLTAANYIWKIAPKDGSVIANAHESLPLRQLLGDPAVQYDAARLQWIGSPEATNQTIAIWHTVPVSSIEDIKTHEVIMGGTTPRADSSIILELANRLVGTKFKIILGYQANQIDLAMERGEVQGRAVIWNGVKATKPTWLTEHKIKIVAQLGLKRDPELPDVPLLQDLARDDDGRLIIQLYSAQLALGRPIYAPPGVPRERVMMLREAFETMVASPEFRDDADKVHYEVRLVTGAEVEDAVRKIMSTPADLAAKAGLSQGD